MNHIFDKRARKNKFCSLWGGSKQKTANSCIECQWAFKKTRQCYYTKSHGKNATKRRTICSQNFQYHSAFLWYLYSKKKPQLKYSIGPRIVRIFVQKLCFTIWNCTRIFLDQNYIVELTMVQFCWSEERQITDPICAMGYGWTEFRFAMFWPLIIRAWNQTDLQQSLKLAYLATFYYETHKYKNVNFLFSLCYFKKSSWWC